MKLSEATYFPDAKELTRHGFVSHMEDFIGKLIGDSPLSADVDDYLKGFDIDSKKALEMLTKPEIPDIPESAVIIRTEKIKNGGYDENGKPMKDKFQVIYRVPKKDMSRGIKGIDEKLRNMYIKLFENHIVEGVVLNEDGEGGICGDGGAMEDMGGATTTFGDGSGQYTTPLKKKNRSTDVVRRSSSIYGSKTNESRIRRTMYITEAQMKAMQVLLEADDRIKKVNRMMDAAFSGLLNLDDKVSGSEYYVNGDPETTWRKYILFSLRHTFGLMTNADVQYLPVVARLAFSDEVGFEKRNGNGREIATLQKIVNLMKKDVSLFNELKANQTITFLELCRRLEPVLKKHAAADLEAANSVETRTDYDIKEVPDFETAEYYGDRTCSESKLCYTQYEDTWDNYTRHGACKVYVCLRNGWENVPEVPGPGNPYDEYGTSMIFVFIDENGDIAYSNCRWNHHTTGEYQGDVDHAFTKATLSQTVGVRFSDVFKPYSREELHARGFVFLDEVQEMLDSGADPEDVFDYVGSFGEGFAKVNLNDKWNFINQEGKLVSNQWFDDVGDFSEGFARVALNNKWNFINQKGKLLSNQWFDDVGPFREGFAKVLLNNKYNFINQDGKPLSNQWFDNVYYFLEGFARVVLNKKCNFINQEGKLLSNQWFDSTNDFRGGFAIVKLNGEYYFIDTEGKLFDFNKQPLEQQTTSIQESKYSRSNGRKTMFITEKQMMEISRLLKEEEGGFDGGALTTSNIGVDGPNDWTYDVPFGSNKKDPAYDHSNIFRKSIADGKKKKKKISK